jgi:hypothetical protein
MSNRIIISDLLEELSTKQQQVLAGGRRGYGYYRPPIYGGGYYPPPVYGGGYYPPPIYGGGYYPPPIYSPYPY